MSDLAKAADKYRKAHAALAQSRTELEEAIGAEGFAELHRHIVDSRVVDVVYQDVDGETKRFEEFAGQGEGQQ